MSNNAKSDNDYLKKLDANILKSIRIKGLQMDKEIEQAKENLQEMIVEGTCADGFVTAVVDADLQVIELKINDEFTDWQADQTKTCEKIIESIHDAVYKAKLIMKNEIETIQYRFVKDFIEKEL